MKTSKPLAIVVDDQEPLRVMLRSFLSANGFRVLTAPTGPHALRICRRIKRPIKVMITGVQMPEMSGFDLASKAAELRPEMPVLLMSGGVSDFDFELRNRLGPRPAFIQKPFSWTSLKLLVDIATRISPARGLSTARRPDNSRCYSEESMDCENLAVGRQG